MSDIVERLRSISGVDGGTSLRELCQEAAAVIEEQRRGIVWILSQAAAEIEQLREERLTNEEVGAICWARAGLLADSDETKARGLRERSEHSREAAETLTRLLERQPLPPGPEGE